VCHRSFTRLTGQGLTKNQIAATPQCQYPWPGGVVHMLLDDEAVGRCRAALESAGI
jgi:hypothetical protein